eukprot:5936518-Pyramimonas_sp.AAC.1
MLSVSYPFGSSIPMSQWCAAVVMAAYSRRASCISTAEGSSASSLSLLILGSWVMLAKRKASTCVGS